MLLRGGPGQDRHDRFRPVAVCVLLVALAVFGALADELAEWQPFVSLDRHVDEELNEGATPWVTSSMEAISWLGSPQCLLVVSVAAAGLLLAVRRLRAAALVALALVGAEALDSLFKVEFARPRPSLADPVVPQAHGYAFPSGHATASMAVYGAIAYLAVTDAHRRVSRVVGVIAGLVLVITIGFSRVYLGAHFPSDVIGGWALALAWLALLVLVLFAGRRRRVAR